MRGVVLNVTTPLKIFALFLLPSALALFIRTATIWAYPLIILNKCPKKVKT